MTEQSAAEALQNEHPGFDMARDNAPLAYIRMKTCLARFGVTEAELSDVDLAELEQSAIRTFQLQRAVISTNEAAGVVTEPQQVEDAVAELAKRFPDQESFNKVLQTNQLDLDGLRLALYEELQAETVLDYICSDVPIISREQAFIYYESHPDKFAQPERRKVSHILLTINDDFPENTREQAMARITELKHQATTETFEQLAKRHSECPTAMHGGLLGLTPKGQLYPEIDQALFNMEAGEVSEPIESEVGFHLILCHEVMPEHKVSFANACEQIRHAHLNRAKKAKKKTWLANLMATQRPLDG
ncbi:nitrogen fixation protein NifM [Corallincola platygyrae]|uniref:peptidylprolyl isomerase n=1 Tax=Corallincola platygyrae TaxID=1193278 RepID=A0ABW4XGB5_9GAMM